MDQILALVTETGSAEWWRDLRSPCFAVLAIQEIAMWCRFLERSIVF